MTVGSTTDSALLSAQSATDSAQGGVALSMLKKSMDADAGVAAELLKGLDGKGANVDLQA